MVVCVLYLHFPLCHSERSEESSRQAQFAPLDCHVATVVAPRNDIMVGHPHPIVRSREIPTVTVFPRNDKEESDCCALYLRQFTSFPFQEMFRLRFTPLNMTRGGGV